MIRFSLSTSGGGMDSVMRGVYHSLRGVSIKGFTPILIPVPQ